MNPKEIRKLLCEVRAGKATVDEVFEQLKSLPFADIGDAKVDTHRSLRTGFPEVIFCQGKRPDQVRAIFRKLCESHGRALGTRATPEHAAAVTSEFSEAHYDAVSRLILLGKPTPIRRQSTRRFVAVVSAGTADMPVAEEAAQTLEFLGSSVRRVYDVGVAGIHRLLAQRHTLEKATAIICVAGMEGALASVVGGLVACPVVAVPTSVGYGAHFSGLAPLLTMINSCATGVAVVNIDNGFGAAVFAHQILAAAQPKRTHR